MTNPTACRKCDAELRPGAEACGKCGLLIALAPQFDKATVAAASTSGSPTLLAAWELLRANWDDPSAHERFVNLAAAEHLFAWGARQYRTAMEAATDNNTLAVSMQARLARMAEAVVLAAPTVERRAREVRKPYRSVFLLLFIGVVVLVAGALALQRLRSPGTTAGAPPTGVLRPVTPVAPVVPR